MRHFTCVQDVGDLKQALNEAFEIKKDRFQFTELGKNKTLLMIFFNPPLYPEGCDEPGDEHDGARREPGCLETGNRTRCHHGWRQTRTFAGGYSCHGLLLRHHRCPFLCPFRKQGGRLQ